VSIDERHGRGQLAALSLLAKCETELMKYPLFSPMPIPKPLREPCSRRPTVESRESYFEHLARRREGRVGVVLDRDGCAEDGKDAVAP
jgi:hypothetical protein